MEKLYFLVSGRRWLNVSSSGHSRVDLTDEPLKFWQVLSYLVVYDPLPRPINVMRIVHTSRNIRRLLSG